MTDTAHATPGPLPPPPAHRSHGCLWGCLIAVGIFLALAIGGGAYVYYYLSHIVKDTPTVKAAIVQVDSDPAARALLGDNVEVTGASSFSSSSDLTTGSKETYLVHVKGSKGEGELTIDADTPKGGALHFDKLSLSANGQTLDILHASDTPPANTGDSAPTNGGDNGPGNGDNAPPTNGGDTGGSTDSQQHHGN